MTRRKSKRVQRVRGALKMCAAFKLCIALLLIGAPARAEHPVFGALANSNTDSVREQVSANPALVGAKDDQGRTLLHGACARHQRDLVIFLLDKGADVNARDNTGATPLQSVLSRAPGSEGNSTEPSRQAALEIMRLLLDKGADVNARDKSGRTALYRAMQSGQSEAIQFLRDKGAKDVLRELLAAVQNSDVDAVQKMLAGDALLVNAADTQGFSLLHQAVRWRDLPLAKVLLDKNADLNARNAQGETPLHLAIATRQLEMVRLLLEKGAPSEDKAQSGVRGMSKSPLMRAYEAGDAAILKLLLDKGADLSASEPRSGSKIGDFLLAEAATASDLELAKLLLEKGARPLQPQLLKRPIRSGDLAMTKLLLENGALPSGPSLERDREGPGIETPLHWAVRGGRLAIAELLLNKGANLKRLDHSGQTPLTAAILNGDASLVQLLLDKGAAQAEKEAGAPSHPLRQALYYGDRALVEQLVKGGVTFPDTLIDAVLRGDLPGVQAVAKNAVQSPQEARSSLDEKISALHVAALLGKSEIAAWLLEHGFSATLTTRNGQTPLHWAALSNSTPIVRLLLDKGADANVRDRLQQTPLHLAALSAGRDIIFLLLDKGAERDAVLSSGFERPWVKGTTPLLRAAWAGNSAAVGALLERGANPNTADESAFTPLLAAAQARDEKSLALLLDKGALFSHFDRTRRMALHYVAAGRPERGRVWSHPLRPLTSVGDVRAALSVLLQRGAKLSTRDAQGRAPLDEAVQSGDTQLVGFLLDKGAAINDSGYGPGTVNTEFPSLEFPSEGYKIPPREGATPLHQAVFRGDEAMVELLLARGADKNIEDAFGRTPLDIALQRGLITRQAIDFPFAPGHISLQSEEPLEDDENPRPPVLKTRQNRIAALLRAAGARPGKGPFFEAVRNGATHVVRQMLQETPALSQTHMGFNQSTNDQGGFLRDPSPFRGGVSPLALAVQKGHNPIAALLLAQGAKDTPAPGQPGILHIAARNGNLAIVRLLLENGQPVDARDGLGKTALHTAAANGMEEMVSLLLEKGADVNARDKEGATPLNDARMAPNNNVSGNRPGSPNISVSTRLPNGNVVQSESNGVAALLAAKGARPGQTYFSLIYQNDVGVLSEMLKKEPELTKHRLGGGLTLLHMAAAQNKPELVDVLAARGADVNAVDDSSRTPLHTAIAEGHRTVVEVLLEKGADANIDPDAKRPERWSSKNTLNGPERVRVLARPPLFAAISKGNKELVSLLLARGAKADMRDAEGVTALQWAEQQGKTDILPLLKGTAPGLGATPTLSAVRFGTPAQLQEFLHGALATVPVGSSCALSSAPSYEVRRAIKANQPQAGDALVKLAVQPQNPLHRQALSLFLSALPEMSAEQITAYLSGAIVLEAKLRPQYPEGYDASARFQYGVRHGWEGFPKDFKLQTRTTHFIDGKPFEKPFSYQGPMATTGWLKTGKLDLGEHKASVQLEFDWEYDDRRGKGRIESAKFPFKVVKATIPDDLVVRDSPEDQQLVRNSFKVSQRFEGTGNHRFHSSGRDKRGQAYELLGPVWNVERPLPFALSFDVEIHVAEGGAEKVFKGNSVFVPAGQAYKSYFIPYIPQEFIEGRAGTVPVKIVLLPSYGQALSDPTIKAFFADSMTFENLHITITRQQN